ncbi:MAG: hypothetical protein LUH15_07605 [Tannerellaceae bacterium]|nr:hypothetical protein [Tannerellaceae bacterium]
MELYSTDIRILFYCEYRENHLKTIFETQDKNEQLIDTFIVGESKKETYLRTNIEIDTKWPVIETSDGELIVTPDGQFIYVDTTP